MQRILIVEDDATISGGIRLYLQGKGFAADCAGTIARAETLLAGSSYHLILLDIRLPDGSGLELCSRLRKISAAPVIFLTANDTESQMIAGFQHGCDDYIAKPFSIELAVPANPCSTSPQSECRIGRRVLLFDVDGGLCENAGAERECASETFRHGVQAAGTADP